MKQKGQVPTDWKLANIMSLHKKGPKSSPENYRLIRFDFGEIKDNGKKLVRDKIMGHMEENGLFTKHQHGFRKGYSCVTQLICICDNTEDLELT